MQTELKRKTQSAADHYYAGVQLLTSKKYEQALKKFEKAEAQGLRTFELFVYAGGTLNTLGRFDEAIAKFEQAEKFPEADGLLYVDWGEALAGKKENRLAIEKFKKALELMNSNSSLAHDTELLALLKWGNALYDQQLFAEAIEKYREILAIHPSYVDAHYNIGLASYSLRDDGAAREYFENAIRLDPHSGLYQIWYGETLLNVEEYEKALTAYETALELGIDEKNQYQARRNAGFALVKLQRADEAIEKFAQAEKISQTDGYLYLYWGDALKAKNEDDPAVEKYQTASGFDETRLIALLRWGNIYYEQQHYRQAKEKYAEILKIDPDYAEAHYNTGLSAYFTDDYETAKASFENALRVRKDSFLLHSWLAAALMKLEDYKNAVAIYQAAALLDDDDQKQSDICRNLGIALMKLNDPDAAAENFKRAADLASESGSIYLDWGDALAEHDDPDDAAEKYEKACRFEDTRIDALLKLGNLYYDRKDYEAAIAKYRETLAEDENYLPALYNTGLASFWLKDFVTAKSHLERAVSHNGENADYRFWLAENLSHLKDYAAAAAEYRAALNYEEKDLNKYYTARNLGFALARLADFDEAIKYYELADQLFEDETVLNYGKDTELADEGGWHYLYWGEALTSKGNLPLAEEKYHRAAEFAGTKFHAIISLGDLSYKRRRYTDAINYFERAVAADEGDPVGYYNLADCYCKIGRYAKSRQYWKRCLEKFEERERDAEPFAGNYYYYYLYARVRHYVFGELEHAENLYEKGYEELNEHEKLDRLALFLELKDQPANGRRKLKSTPVDEEFTYQWKEQSQFDEIENSLKKKLNELGDLKTKRSRLESLNFKNSEEYLKNRDEIARIDAEIARVDELYYNFHLGYLYFQKSRFEEAARYFETAYKIEDSFGDFDDPRRIEISNALGNCHSLLGNHQKAVAYIEETRRCCPEDIEFQYNLAIAYLRAYYDLENSFSKGRYLDLAESEFEKILRRAPYNVDALVGLGYTKIEQSDFKKQNLYQEAAENFTTALELYRDAKGSSRITKKQEAQIYYHIGYAHIKMYENSHKLLNENLRSEATKNFLKAYETDNHNQSARKACDFLKKNKNRLAAETFIEKWGPIFICVFALFVFGLSLSSFFWNVPAKELSPGDFAILGFGSLAIFIAGLSLPQLLKLKIAGIEMEKEIKKSTAVEEDFSSITKLSSDLSKSNITSFSQQAASPPSQERDGKTNIEATGVKSQTATGKSVPSNGLNLGDKEAAKSETTVDKRSHSQKT